MVSTINSWDFIMFWLSNKLIWIPFYLFLFYLIIKHYGKKSYIIIIAALLLVTFTDMASYNLFKLIIQRLRPCHEPSLQGMIYTLNGHCGGMYGFVSSHAANTFGLAVFISLFLAKKSDILILLCSVGQLAFVTAGFISACTIPVMSFVELFSVD